MLAADYHDAPISARIRYEIGGAMELVRLRAHERDESGLSD
jgi:hypothetical protein